MRSICSYMLGAGLATVLWAPPACAQVASLAVSDPLVSGLSLAVIVLAAGLAAFVVRLRRSRSENDRYQTLFLQSSEGILITDGSGHIVDANPTALELLGYQRDQLLGSSGTSLWHPDDLADVGADAERLDAGETVRVERRLRTRGERFVLVQMSIKRLSRGMTQVMFRDLTRKRRTEAMLKKANQDLGMMYEKIFEAHEREYEINQELLCEVEARKKVENVLREREATMQGLFRAAPVGIAMVDENHALGWTNPMFREMTGYKANELEGQSMAMLHESEAEFLNVSRRGYAQLLESGVGSVETRLLTREGKLMDVIVNTALIDQGDPSGAKVVTVLDITRRKQVESERDDLALLRHVFFDRTLLGEVLVDPRTGHMVEANKAACSLLGISQEQVDGMPVGAMLSRAGTDQLDLAAILSGEIARFGVRVEAGGEVRDLEIHSCPVTLQGKTMMYGLLQDVTLRLQAEHALKEAMERAESADRAKGEFLANMSHELRTPLNGVLGMLHLLGDTSLDDRQREFVESASMAARGLTGLFSDILDFVQIETGRATIASQEFSLHRIVDDVAGLFRPECGKKGLEMVVEVDPAIPDDLVGDSRRLRQILFNLVGNAVKFTVTGRVTLRVALGGPGQDPAGVPLVFTVEDTGPGISREKLDQVFAPFSQADNSLNRPHTGTGLGLSIVKRLLPVMGGGLDVDSEPGRGTRISVSLVFARKPEAIASRGPLETAERLHVLVADDNRVDRMACQGFLEKLGHRVTCLNDGSQVLGALESTPFDCVFLDIEMPEQNGVETTRLIRSYRGKAFDPDIPIVALTAHGLKEDRDSFLKSGMDAYLPKPFELDEISMVLRSVTNMGKPVGPQQ